MARTLLWLRLRCIRETLEGDYTITPEREKLPTESAGQIEAAVPNLEEPLQKSNGAEPAQPQEDDLPSLCFRRKAPVSCLLRTDGEMTKANPAI